MASSSITGQRGSVMFSYASKPKDLKNITLQVNRYTLRGVKSVSITFTDESGKLTFEGWFWFMTDGKYQLNARETILQEKQLSWFWKGDYEHTVEYFPDTIAKLKQLKTLYDAHPATNVPWDSAYKYLGVTKLVLACLDWLALAGAAVLYLGITGKFDGFPKNFLKNIHGPLDIMACNLFLSATIPLAILAARSPLSYCLRSCLPKQDQ